MRSRISPPTFTAIVLVLLLPVLSAAGSPSGDCGAPRWARAALYTGGAKVVYQDYLWQAERWTQGDTPAANDGGPWAAVGYCSPLPGPAAGRMFAPYVDVNLGFNLTEHAKATGGYYSLGFLVDGGGCTAKWGGTAPLPSNLYLADIESLRAVGGDVIVSFGGESGGELGSTCPTAAAAQAQYQAVIAQYKLKRIDLDIEGGGFVNYAQRNQAIAALQAANPGLEVSYTLPVLSTGLLANSIAVLKDAFAKGVKLSTVNVMAMDYGPPFDNGNQMELSSIRAAWSTMSQLQRLLPSASHAEIARMTGLTPMIGQNDVRSEIFPVRDAAAMAQDAKENGVGFLSFWSITRDEPCPREQATGAAGPRCSGAQAEPLEFSYQFKKFLD
ncbi:MAG: chitinase [Bryobacteraceae bacterium]